MAVVRKALALPLKARVPCRSAHRFRADTLLCYLETLKGRDTMILALTASDISHTNAKSADYGIMGLASMVRGTGIVSTARVKGINRWDKMVKRCLHEIGHMKGLPHCAAPACLMRDAEGKDHLDDLKCFCPECLRVFRSK